MKEYRVGMYVNKLVELVYFHNLKTAVKYIDENTVVKATMRDHSNVKHYEILVTIGRPNYAERAFIRMAKKAGEPFPIKKIHVK